MRSPHRRLPLVGLLVANVVSVLGGAMSLIAVPWFVFEMTGSAALTGIAAVSETLPVVAVSLVAGSIVRRFGARHTRAWSDVIAGIAVLSVPVLHATVGIAYWQLLVLAAINGALRTPAVAASLVLLREVTRLAGLTNDQTTGPYAASVRLAATLGAPVAGVLIVLIGAPGVLVVDAVSFLVSAVIIWSLVPPEPVAADTRPGPARGRRLSDLTRGFRALRADQVLLILVGLSVMHSVMAAGWNSVAAPIYGQTVLDSAVQLGLLLGLFGAGAVVGNVAYASLSRRASPLAILGTALVLSGPVLWLALAVQLPLPVLAVVLPVAGVGFGVMPPLYLTLQYDRVAPDDQGHLFGLTFGMETAGQALGAALAGAVLTFATLQATLFGMAVVTAAVAAAALLTRPLRELRSPVSRVTEPVQPDHV